MQAGDIYGRLWKLTVVCAVVMMVAEARRECLANTTLGSVKGSKETSRHGEVFCSYRGIPYAKPPVGELRFMPPQMPEPWSRVLNARHNAHMCIQNILGVVLGEEDCLYLNVYTPDKISEERTNLPTMVFVHGGKYTVGSGASYMSGPQYLLDKDVVLVTINYRLGVMGFLSTGDDNAPGNWAMKDQVAALRWVKDNIHNFGGDPDKITLMGQSAGAKSVHFHMFSPLSKGLFHRAISHSGSVFMPWVLPPSNPVNKAQKQAKAVGCPTGDNKAMMRCLRNIEAKDLVRSQLPVWQPVVEVKSISNREPFLTASPLDLVHSGNFTKVPWLMGSTSEDGAFFGARKIYNESQMQQFSERMDKEGPKDFFLSLSMRENLVPDVWQKVRNFYFGDNDTATAEGLIKLYTDRYVVHAVHTASILHSKAGHDAIYKYNFAYRGLYSFGKLAELGSSRVDLGVVHGDDLIYIFVMPLFKLWPLGHPDKEVMDLMITLWTNFATYGNPTPSKGVRGVMWKPFDLKNHSYLNIGQDNSGPVSTYGIRPIKIHMEENLYQDRMEFWDSLPLREKMVQEE